MPVPIMVEVRKYVSELDPNQGKIFVDCFKQYRWNKIREKLGLGDFKFHDLRKIFVLFLLRMVYLLLLYRDCWNILQQILPTKCI